MLPFHGRWRNASKQAPEREARLLMFASGIVQPGDPDFSMPKKNPGERPLPTDEEYLKMSKEEKETWRLIVDTRMLRQQEAGNRPRPADVNKNVTDTASTTASQVSDVLNNPTPPPEQEQDDAAQTENDEANEVERQSYQETKAVTDEMVATLGTLLHKLHSNNAAAEQFLSPEQYEKWVSLQTDVAATLGGTQRDRDLMDIIGNLEQNRDAGMPPNGTIAFARRTIKKRIEEAKQKSESVKHYEDFLVLLDNADAIIQGRTNKNATDVSSLAGWQTLNDEQKMEIYEHIRNALHVDEALLQINESHKSLADLYFDQSKDVVEFEGKAFVKKGDMAKTMPSTQEGGGGAGASLTPKSLWKALQNLPGNVGIEFYSPLQIWEAFKQVGETLQDISKKKNALKIASFADKLGGIVGIIPKYKNAKELLRRAHEEENEKIKKGYKEALGASNWQPGYHDMFGPGKLMDQNIDDKNMTMAILEYAASKGMIYNMKDIDWKKGDNLFGRWNIRELVPSSWDENQIGSYYGNIEFDNEQGEKKQEKIGYDNNITYAKIPQFMKSLNEALSGKDLWYARGVVKRAMEKVDTGHMSSIIAVTIMRHIEKDPDLGKVIPTKWLDQIGGEGKELNMGLLKFEQGYILAWAKEGGGDIRRVPRLGNFMADVRAYIIEKDKSLEATDDKTVAKLDEMTSQLMSAKTLKHKGKTLTIYDKRFDPYVGELLKEANWARGIPMDKSWDDFFVSQSEFQRGSQTIYDAIFEMDVKGTFKHEPRARFFLSWIEKSHQELLTGIREATDAKERAELKAAEENFRKQTQAKLDASIAKMVDRAESFLATRYILEYHRSPVFITLIEQGLLSLSVFEEALRRNPGNKFARAVVEQCTNRGLISKALHSKDINDENEAKPEEKDIRAEERERAKQLEDQAKAIKALYFQKETTGGKKTKNTPRRNNPPPAAGATAPQFSTGA